MSILAEVQSKITTIEKLASKVDKWRAAGEKIVFTNGCFDILHQGHVCYLAKAADFGTKLIVALNTDRSVKKQNKGTERPINPENARMLILASLSFVDAVLLFDDETPLTLIQKIKPEILVKGADYDPNETNPSSKKYIVGRDVVLQSKGQVKVVELEEGFSTTAIVTKLKTH
jgi:rfaE bifunctional protein nucleotidyltransferase chain/domain